MRISELAKQTGISIPTIKYYLREGLLPRGDARAPNQADYGAEHVHRLRLIRALTEVGGLSLAAVREVLDALDTPDLPMHEVFGVAHARLRRSSRLATSSPELEEALVEVDEYLKRLRWRIEPTSPPRRDLAEALVVLRRLGHDVDTSLFDPYAEVADRVAERELEQVQRYTPRERRVEAVVLGTIVNEVVLSALRRLAQEHHSARRFGRRSRSTSPREQAKRARRRP